MIPSRVPDSGQGISATLFHCCCEQTLCAGGGINVGKKYAWARNTHYPHFLRQLLSATLNIRQIRGYDTTPVPHNGETTNVLYAQEGQKARVFGAFAGVLGEEYGRRGRRELARKLIGEQGLGEFLRNYGGGENEGK